MKKIYSLLSIVILLLVGNNVYSQVHFKPVGDFTEAMSINILEAKVNGVNLIAGDEIGIFDGTVCVGSVGLTKNLLLLGDIHVAASKAGANDTDTPVKDGYIAGNPISFRLYDTSEDEEIPLVVATFVSNVDLSPITPSPTFNKDITAYVSLLATHNYTPKAKAGSDKELLEGASGSLDGSLSSDFEGSTITYNWDDLDNINLSATNVAQPTFTAPLVNADKQYRVALTVNDGEKNSKPDTVIVTVKQINYPPVANAGADFEIAETTSVLLDGNGSTDPDGLALTYSWTIEPPDFTLAAPNEAITDFTAPQVTNDKEYLVILTVTNTVSLSDKDTVIVIVKNFNLKPVAKAGLDQEVNEDVIVKLNGSASSDPDNAPNGYLHFKWTSILGNIFDNDTLASPEFVTPFFLKDSTLRIVLVVNDGAIDSNPDTVLVKVKHANIAPIANASADQEVNEGVNVTLSGLASSDPDKMPNVSLSYQWTSVEGVALNNATSVSPDFTAPFYLKDSTLQFVLIVSDGALDSKKDTVLVKVKHTNLAPTAKAGIDQEVNEGVIVTLSGAGSSDADTAPNPVLTYLWTSVQGITINNSTTVSPDFTTPFYLIDSLLQFILVVNDGEDNSNPDTVVVKVKHKNLAPTANAGTDFSVNENMTGQLNGSGSKDLDGTIVYMWDSNISIPNRTLMNPTFIAPEVQKDSIITFYLTVSDNNSALAKDAVDVTIKHVNKKPVADAGADQEVDENVVISLDGSKSSDPDMVDSITYKWVAPAGIALDDVTSATPKFTSPTVIEEFVNYTFKLVVNDGKLDSDTDNVVVKVIHLNIAPVADAGADINIDENVNGNLDGSKSSDFEGKPLTYSWTAPAGIVVSDLTIAKPSFDAPEVEKDTVFTVVLIVNDGVRNSIPDTVKINVNHINKQPVANGGFGQVVDENVLVTLDGTASMDADKYDVITYLWTSTDGAVLNDPTSATPTFTSPWLMNNKVFGFILVVNDGTVNSVDYSVSVLVKHANLKPTADAGLDISVNEGAGGNLNGSGSSDPEGMALTYLWTAPAGFIINNRTTVSPTFIAPLVEEDTDFKIILTVDDDESLLNIDKDTILVKVLQVNKLPVANAGADITVREQKAVMLNGSASSDPDALDAIAFNWIAPAGVVLDDKTLQKPSFIAGDVAVDTELEFVLEVTDKSLAIDKDTIVVTVTANKAPLADAGANQKARPDVTVTLHGENSSDPDGDVLTYAWTAPVGIILTNPTNAKPTFVAPFNDDEKTYSFTLEVKDDLGLTDTHTVDVTVISNLPPVIVTEPVIYVFEGETVLLDASETTDPDNDVLIFDWFHANPALIKTVPLKNVTTSVASFVAPQVEKLTYIPIVLRVADGTEDSYATVKVYVKDIINTAPVAHAGIDMNINEGVSGKLDGSASSDMEGKPITYLWTSNYLVLDNVTLVKPAFAAPEVKADTTVMVTLVVNDGKFNSAPDTAMITVKHVNKKPVANAGANIVVNEGDKITFDGSASTDPDGDVITYKWSALGFSITGADLAMATTKAPEVQKDMMAPFVLTVKDGMVNSLPDTVWVTVKQVNKAPVWNKVPADIAFVGYEYSTEIKVTDTDLLDKISITSTDLPAWLILTDKGNGTATLTTDSIPRMESLLGTHSFTVKASDGTVTIESAVKLTITVKTGIENLTLSTVKFYPNPTNGLVNVEFTSLPEMGTTIQVFNQLGQTVVKQQATSQTTELNLTNNPAGIYIIKVTSQKASRTGKIILK